MRKLLTKETVTLQELYIFYNPAHHQRELCFSFNLPKFIPYIKGGRGVTVNKLRGIAKVLYGNSKKFKHALNIPSGTNLLDQPFTCSLIFVNDVLVAVGKEENDAFCHLVTGHVLDGETLLKIYKCEEQKKMLAEIHALSLVLEQKMSEYNELEKMTF